MLVFRTYKTTRDKNKFGKRNRKCIFVGYPFGKKDCKFYDMENNEFFVSQDVVFNEESYPYASNEENQDLVSPSILIPAHAYLEEELNTEIVETRQSSDT